MKEYIKERDQEWADHRNSWGRNIQLGQYIDTYTKYIRWRNKNKANMLVRVSGDSVSIFTNEIGVLKSLEKVDSDITPAHVEVNIDCAPGVMLRKEPKHGYRVYLKSRRAKDGFRQELCDFLTQRKASVFPCKALDDWVHNRNKHRWLVHWTQSSHFMEFDDESMITLMKLYFGDILGKMYKIEKRPQS